MARLTELVDHATPWHRRLWQIGSLLVLDEVLEYATGVRDGVAKAEGLTFVTSAAANSIPRDLGLGDGTVRDHVVQILSKGAHRQDGVLNEQIADSLAHLVQRVRPVYLKNWSVAYAAGAVGAEQVELMARLVIAHLLDAGFASDHLHGWLLAARDPSGGEGGSLEEVLEHGSELLERSIVDYEVIVPFTSLPPEVVKAAGDRFTPWADLEARLSAERLPTLRTRQGVGALRFHVSAREPKAAIASTEVEVRRLSARVGVGLRKAALSPTGHALVLPGARPKWRPLDSRTHDIFLSSITRHDLLFPAKRTEETRALDDAIELLASAESATSWTAVAAMWAAVEGLLTRPGDPGVRAADRMAAIVAGGFVRAELTQLVDVFASSGTELATTLSATNLSLTQKIDLVLLALDTGDCPDPTRPEDAAAIARVRGLVTAPAATMSRVQGYYAEAFRRLYMQRNLLLHGGRFDSVALPATMRTLPPLVGAGLDRLVHGALQTPQAGPFDLAARAELELGFLGKADARALHRLLE